MPLQQHISFSDGTLLYLWNVTETENELDAQCRAAGIDISPVQHYRSARRRIEVMVEWLTVYHVLGPDVQLGHDDKGAPVAVGSSPTPYLSISHTTGLVCLACNTDHPIGIDVERHSERILRVRSRFLHDDELATISPDDITANLIAWTAKEALYKVSGNTRTNFADDIRLQHYDTTQDAPITLQATCHDVPHRVATMLIGTFVFSIAVEDLHGYPLPENNYQNTNIIAL